MEEYVYCHSLRIFSVQIMEGIALVIIIISKKGAIFFSLRKKDCHTIMHFPVLYLDLICSKVSHFLKILCLFMTFVGYVIYCEEK
jgi:hypothetical protein